MKKISNRIFKKISKRDINIKTLIKKMRNIAKKDPGVIKAFKFHGININEIDNIKIQFVPMDVSAKTINCEVFINEDHLKGDSFKNCMPYFIHEAIHCAQQMAGHVGEDRTEDYLDKPSEEEAFKAQIDYKQREEGNDAAEEYVEDLLEYHDFVGKEKIQKKKELLK